MLPVFGGIRVVWTGMRWGCYKEGSRLILSVWPLSTTQYCCKIIQHFQVYLRGHPFLATLGLLILI